MYVRGDGVMVTRPTENVDSPDDNGAPSVIHDEALNTWFAESFRRFLEYHVLGTEGDDSSGFYGRTVMKAVGIAIDERLGPLEQKAKQIDELRLQVATAMGAIDDLRGKEVPGSFNFLRQEMLDSVGDALGMARAEFEDKLAVQGKRISELELKLAEAVGAISVLRGKGAPGSFNVRGTFDPDRVYSYLDVVAFNGSSWVATRDSPGDLPGPGWQLLSSVGKRGRRGERGERGPVGEPGLSGAGAAGFASWRLDCVRYTATPMMSDGSLGPPLELRSLFAQFLAEVNGS